jgi:hypothetical protein
MAFGPFCNGRKSGRTFQFTGKRQKASLPRSSAGLPILKSPKGDALVSRF